jgi:hypothetical protein
VIRPGALLAPVWVWHELQLPFVCMVAMAMEPPALFVTFAENGVFIAVEL